MTTHHPRQGITVALGHLGETALAVAVALLVATVMLLNTVFVAIHAVATVVTTTIVRPHGRAHTTPRTPDTAARRTVTPVAGSTATRSLPRLTPRAH